MAEKSDRLKRILNNALNARRKLCFDTDALGDGCTNNMQRDNTAINQRHAFSSIHPYNAQLSNLAEQDEVNKSLISLTELSTSYSQTNQSSCAASTQPKIIILSDTIISGPSQDPKSFCGIDIAKPDTHASELLQSTSQMHELIENHESSTIFTIVNHEEITAPSIQEPGGIQYREAHTKPLSPVIIINNDSDNIDSSDVVATDNIETVDKGSKNILKDKEIVSNTEVSKKSKRKEFKTSYMDFMSDDGDFEWSSSSWEGESSSDEEEEQNKSKKRKKSAEDGKIGDHGLKKKAKQNKRKERSLKRNIGLPYSKQNGTNVAGKTMKENPCKPDKKCPHNCHEISEERRQQIFAYYYSLSSQRKRDWLVANSQVAEVKRKRTKENLSRRQNTFLYFINEGEGRRQICQKFLLNTLDLSQRFIHYTISNAEFNLSKTDMRGKHVPANKTPSSVKQGVVDYIKNLPAVPSHYCRKDSTRLYLPQEFKSLSHLYQLYKIDYSSKGKDYVGEKVFKNIFTSEFNITVHIPKKDKCKKCVSFTRTNNPTNVEEEKKAHLKEAEDSKARFKFHQNITKHDSHTLCVSFDLQKVLNTPYGESMLFYYSRKYCVYNLTFYESSTREGYCYSWGESDGKRGGNEIATILQKYIQVVDYRGTVKNLILYSDSCSGQNKNKIVFAAVHTVLQICQQIESIQMNFLLPGHTSMPVDSMHAIIESSIKHTVIHAPSQWSTVFSLARKNPKPYNVEILKYSDFVAWDSISDKYFKNNLAGKISQIRVITFKKSDPTHIFIKKSMKNEEKYEKVFVLGKNRVPSDRLYKKSLPISDAKFNDLAKHCKDSSIPRQFHDKYLKISHGNIKDILPESDVEDSD